MKIEKGIPAPIENFKVRFPFDEMQVGDSIFIPKEHINSACASIVHFACSRSHFKYTSKKEGDGKRFWRLDDWPESKTKFVIEKGIPIPKPKTQQRSPKRRHSTKKIYPISELTVGDSFIVSINDFKKARNAMFQYKYINNGFTFAYENIKKNTAVRFWRTA